jgi:MFS family permease
MTVMHLTIVNTALPTIGRKLHFSQTSLLWVVTAYGLAYGGFLLLGGRAADLLGRRRMIIAGLAVFKAASLGASLAGTRGHIEHRRRPLRHARARRRQCPRGTHGRIPRRPLDVRAVALLAIPVTFLLIRKDEMAAAVAATAIREPLPEPAT